MEADIDILMFRLTLAGVVLVSTFAVARITGYMADDHQHSKCCVMVETLGKHMKKDAPKRVRQ